MKHIGLFEGIGGFSLAARWSGWDTIAWVEINPFCQKVLAKNFPNAIGFSDIREFDGKPFFGQIGILTGGFPCQPFSVAGKRKGNEDERALWFEMYRVIREVKPMVVVAENVGGILTIENGLVFERVCLDLEAAGYEVQPFVIPACAVGAPHRRDRVWIVAKNTVCDGRECNGHQESATFREFGNIGAGNGKRICDESDIAYSNKMRKLQSQGIDKEIGQRISDFNQDVTRAKSTGLSPRITRQGQVEFWGSSVWSNWYEAATELCRVDDGLSSELDKLRNSDRGKRIEALGNSIVPQVAFQIFQSL
jgi:DNA (cytosine-5)-methyltransferase 1